MKNFRTLNVSLKAHEFILDIYKITENFPNHQKYSLVQQLQRAAVSIEANIAEGCFRSSDPDFARFLHMAGGSASECDCLIEIAKDLGFLDDDKYKELNNKITEILKMLSTLINKILADIENRKS